MLPETTTQTAAVAAPKKVQSRGGIFYQIVDIIVSLLHSWYWFVLTVALALMCARVYLLMTPAVYTRTASILIKDGKNKMPSLPQMLLSPGASVDVKNELFTLRSPEIASEVVRRLHLEMNYMSQGRFHEEATYGNTLPVNIEVKDLNNSETVNFMFKLKYDGSFIISDLSRDGAPHAGKFMGKVGQTIITPIGKILVTKSPSYTPQERELRVFRTSTQTAINNVMGRLVVSAVDDWSTIINLVYNDVEPQRAEDILSTVIQVYNENWMKDNNRVAVSTSEFIGDRLAIIEKELSGVEDDISDYKSANLLPTGANDMSSLYFGEAHSAELTQTRLNLELSMTRYIRNYITNDANKYQLIPAQPGGNANVGGQVGQYNQMVTKRNQLVVASSEVNPLVLKLNDEMEVLRDNIIKSIDNHIQTLNIQIAHNQLQQSKANNKVATAPQQNRYLLSVERQQKVKEQLYLYLLQKREENELSQAFTAYNSRVITPASGSNIPTFPIPSMVYSLAILLGLAIPAAIIILLEMINNRVRGRKDLEGVSIPFIGEVPLARHKVPFLKRMKNRFVAIRYYFFPPKHIKEDKTLHMVVKPNSRNVINEAFRVVRTNIEFMSAHGGRDKVIMLTSFQPNSGKTFLVSNLITSFSIKDKKVLAIDLDLRKSSLSAMVNKPKKGVADVLSGNVADYHDVIVPVENYGNLYVMPVGTIPPNPTELLFDKTLGEMLTALREEYDYIFLDCPPVEIVADATIVAQNADMSVFIVRADHFDRSMLPELERYYTEGRLPKMCMILNGTQSSFSYYGYGYRRYGYHRYGYGYGYSYGYRSSYGGYTQEDEE